MQTPSAVRRAAVLIPTASAALVLGLTAAPAALAHNVLTGSTPEDGETLDSAPDEVTLTFNEEVQDGGGTVTEENEDGDVIERAGGSGNTIVVTGPDDQTYEDGEVEVDGESASVALRPLETAGEHTIAYRVVSADGHPVEGELTFTLSEDGVAEEGGSGGEGGDDADTAGGDADTDADADTAGSDDGQAEEDSETASDPMSAYGPVGAVVGAIAVVALIIILVVRMRSRPGQGDGQE